MIYPVIFLTSMAVLGFEITFTRIFSYAQWHNLSSVIITMALLGSGAAGTVIALSGKLIRERMDVSLFTAAVFLPLFMASSFIISVSLPLNPYELSFSIKQVIYILIYFFMMALPFFTGSFLICLFFMREPPSGVYAANLFGSGAGAAIPLLLSYQLHPYSIMAVIISLSLIPALLLSSRKGIPRISATLTAVIIFSLIFTVTGDPGFRKVSQYKPISGALNLPGSRIIHESYSPLAVVQVAEAEGLRSAAGLSITSQYQVPPQRVIFFDGDSPSPITPFNGDTGSISYIRHLASWLPYYMKSSDDKKSVLIIGAGGGEPILKAISSGFTSIDAVEVNSSVVSLMKKSNAEYSGGIYFNPTVTIHNEEGRSFIRRSTKQYDLIDIPLLDAYNSAASGVYALNESYLYTVESFSDFYRHLSAGGILSVTRWITTPPRDSLKIFNIAVTMLKEMKIDPTSCLMVARSLHTVTLIISKDPFTEGGINNAKSFCRERLFDIVYYPGIKPEAQDYIIKDGDEPMRASFAALISPSSDSFIDAYSSDIIAPVDNRPYFYNFFKPAFLKYIKTFGPAQVPVTEWGYLLLILILIPVTVLSFLSILLPAIKLRSRENHKQRTVILYFSLIALGFFFIEIPLIQKMILFLGNPVFSMGIIISSLLIFSGLGSLFSGSIFKGLTGILKIMILICGIMLIYTFHIDRILNAILQYPLYIRIISVIIIIAPPAFFMGMPFPRGLMLLHDESEDSIPIAWGVNGFFSVISIICAAICAIISGYKFVLIIAIVCYMAAGIISLPPGVKSDEEINSS